ncbi:MAG: hypothetical protein R3E12_00210 [Candidatus Eisenbacteria bacterium]|uniref:Secreted protein n=1 Tax=Eiseniibacteriota bacterium TaxID=2212470 RepID=A0A956LX70_UNCEI|nr:hypothetical protein [Candidatus Eisenbacteria bacterium]
MSRLNASLLAVLSVGIGIGAAHAGPNAGGVLLLGLADAPYTRDVDYCDSNSATSCNDIVVSIRPYGGDVLVINCLAMFAPGSRLSGITFGLDYDDASVAIVDAGGCGDFELPDAGWPAPGTGTAVTWGAPQMESVVPVYWFAAYSYYYDDSYDLRLIPHPTQGGNFADDDIPANIDPIAGLGRFGFNMPGQVFCPEGGVDVEACCFSDCTCAELLPEDCVVQGGNPQGPGTTCSPDPCECPIGACCLPSGSCVESTADDCALHDGVFMGAGVPCVPDPCEPNPTIESSWGSVKVRYR